MSTNPCVRCETDDDGLRIDSHCPWCYAVVNDRPDDASTDYGEVVEMHDFTD